MLSENSSSALAEARDTAQLPRLMFGTDTPAGFGVAPMGILRLVVEAASVDGIDPGVAWALASGNAARLHGLREGLIEVGRPADLIFIDAPTGSAASDGLSSVAVSDLPHIAAVLIDGVVRAQPSRNTPGGPRQLRQL